ncbi:MAG: SLBB domain-containing protein [Bacteroidales bacterium]|nr:SLBB domain-containing protein [Bacteroidales bacterium]
MIRRIIASILFAFALASFPVKAQMSDDAVYAYVKEALASGKSQQSIVQELAARGVTGNQAERIRRRYENSQSSGSVARSVSSQERSRRNDDYSDISAEEMNLLASQIAIQTEINSAQSQAVNQTPVFGRNVFNNRNLTFAPNSNMATPANYILGPGDEVIIDIWGTNQATIREIISPDGFISIPDIGLVYLNGMTVKEADSFMRKKLNSIYSVDGSDARSDIKLTLGAIRTIQVNVMGEVAAPGTYYLSSLSNVYHALYRAGGFSTLGSMRNIELIRNGKKIEDIDVYDFILTGESPEDVTLQEGDIILVPTYETLVNISGNVKRPMIYEMKDGETVADLLSYAGGFMGNAYKGNLTMVRQNGAEYQVYTIREKDYPVFTLMDGDALAVGAMIDRFENRLEIKGAVFRPGVYQLSDDVDTVTELINAASGLKGDAFTNRALLQRENEDYTYDIIQIDLAGVMAGTAPDVKLQNNDVLMVSSVHDLNDLGFITVTGEVANPGSFVFAGNTTIEDIIIQAGGLLESASTAKVDVSRRVRNRSSMEATDTVSRVYSFSIKDGYLIDGADSFILKPYDQVYVRRSPGYAAQSHVTVEGEVLFPGIYALPLKNTRLSDLVRMSGGISPWAYVKGARLKRKTTSEEIVKTETIKGVFENVKDSLDVTAVEVSTDYFVGIDLENALLHPGSDADVILKQGDVLIVPEYMSTVRISGNVLYPNTVSYDSGMTVKDYITMAGGYGFNAKKSRAYVIYVNGTVAKARRFSTTVIQPGCEIVVPEKKKKDGNGLQNLLSISTTAASLGTMIATIGNLVKP